MEIHKTQEGNVEELTVKGEVDASSSIELDTAIAQSVHHGDKNIVLNFEHLEYISSAGLGVLMSYIEELKNKNTHMVIIGLNEQITHNFNVLGLTDLFHIRKNKEEAKRCIDELSI